MTARGPSTDPSWAYQLSCRDRHVMPRLTGAIEQGAGAYVQLRDAGGDFVGEVRADDDGLFTFYAVPGRWTVVCLTPGRRREQHVELHGGDLDIRFAG